MISVANPGAPSSQPAGFAGKHLQLSFGDVASEADAQQLHTKAPSIQDIQSAISFFREAWEKADSQILITCDYGSSRSPALAYVCLADFLGAGQEEKAFKEMLNIQPNAVPNGMVVRLGDEFLGRKGALLRPVKQLYAKIEAELFPKNQKA